jgi:hypothetical protein
MNRGGISAGTVLYLLVGVIIAANRGYLAAGVHTLGQLISLILEVVLWPLILLGVNLTVTF